MQTKEIALIITFAAVTIALDPVRVPYVLLPGLYFRFCEIPMVIAFILFGARIGIAIAALNVFAEIILFPGPVVFIGRPMVFLLVLCMFLGMYLAKKTFKLNSSHQSFAKTSAYYTVFGTTFRAAAAPVLNFPLYRYAIPFFTGTIFTDTMVLAMIPSFVIYAVIFALYTIPIGCLIAKAVSKNLNIKPKY
jgi:riboflavin transporter FmnP